MPVVSVALSVRIWARLLWPVCVRRRGRHGLAGQRHLGLVIGLSSDVGVFRNNRGGWFIFTRQRQLVHLCLQDGLDALVGTSVHGQDTTAGGLHAVVPVRIREPAA